MAKKKATQTTTVPGAVQIAVFANGRLMNPQPSLFDGWEPYSKSYPASGFTAPSGLWIRDSSEWPSEEGEYSECSLASILETEADWLARNPGKTASDWIKYIGKYSLSPVAASGILRRAAKRGRELPPQLRQALEGLAAQGQESNSPLPSGAEMPTPE